MERIEAQENQEEVKECKKCWHVWDSNLVLLLELNHYHEYYINDIVINSL